MTEYNNYQNETLEEKIQNLYRRWCDNLFTTNLDRLLDEANSILTQPKEEHTPEVRVFTTKVLADTVRHIADLGIIMSDPTQGVLVKSLLRNGNWKAFIEEPDGEYLFACILLDYADRAHDSLECPRTSLLSPVREWTGKPFNFVSESTPSTIGPITRRDLACCLFGDAWAMLYSDEHPRFLAYQYKIVLDVRPPFTFQNDINIEEKQLAIPDDFGILTT